MDAGITPEEIRTRDDDEASARGTLALPAVAAAPATGALDRVIAFDAGRWQTLGWIATFALALALRLPRLDGWALDAGEAARAYEAWTLFRGQPPASGETLPDAGALLLLLEGAAFFLFGATDVVARIVPVLAGLALVALPLALRGWVGAPAALGMAALAALSPTLVYASRVVSSEVIIAALSLAAVACLARLGAPDVTRRPRGAAIALGITLGAAYAAGPSALTIAITLVIAVAVAAMATEGTMRRALRTLRGELPAFLLAAALAVVLAFTRFLSYPPGIAGITETLAAWWRLMSESSGQPAQLFLMILLIYEPIAVAFAVVAVAGARQQRGEAVSFLTAWALAAFALWSFAAGRGPEHAVHVALPLVMLAGIALGDTLHEIDWAYVWRGSGGVLALLLLGIVVGLAAVGVLLTRVDDRGGGAAAALPAAAVLCLVVVPMAYLVWRQHETESRSRDGEESRTGRIALLVLALLLGAYGLRSANLLAFYRADLGTEPLAQRTATLGTLPSIERLLRLARDVGVGEGDARDPTGSHGLSIALEADVHWPYVWYFREFPELSVVDPGAGAASGAEVVIAADETRLTEAGYAVQSWPWLNTVPAQYLEPDVGEAARVVVDPRRWLDLWRFLLFRDGVPLPAPASVAVGLMPELANQVSPSSGPYDLRDRPGPGTQPGQFKDPIGVAVAPDGVIAVVDSGNARVQRFDRDGELLGIWGSDESAASFTRTANGLGPTGVTIAPDGLTWVADTWGHRVVALDANGTVAQVIGAETIDIGDDPARVDEGGGRFFGPRAIAVSDDAIYVTDTGNERVQRFTRDGAFVDAWGGYGTGPDRLIEPVGIALGPDGNLYVADSGNARVSIYTPEGEPVAQWAVPDWPPPNPGGTPPAFQPYLAFDAAGNLYATASNAGQALLFDPAGEVIARISDAGGERLAQPVGVAVAPDGEVLLSDVGRDVLVTYTPPEPPTPEELDREDAGASPGP